MEKWVVLFFIFFPLNAFSQDPSYWITIDCGSSSSYRTTDGILWQTDDKFINTGTNKQVQPSTYTSWEQMNSLRVFKQQNKNCYTLPSNSNERYFIRAMFKYGNYDGLSNAPSFDLEIDGNKIKSIETSIDRIIYSEVIYTSKRDNISVCLSRTQDKDYPFISSLESWPLLVNMYGGMNRDLAWVMSYRYNYGTEDWITGYPGDIHNRIWQPAPTQQDLMSVVSDATTIYYTAYEDPPDSAIFDAVEGRTATDSITLTFPISKISSPSYILMYFTEMSMLINETRQFDTYVDDEFAFHATPEYQNCSKGKAYANPKGTLSVEMRPVNESTLPPIISAIEVYTASDALITTGTSQDDLDGLGAIIKAYERLNGWSGEPCLPVHTCWEWLSCTGSDPPTVTSLNLAGYGLDGSLPSFSQMRGLESIDLSNNSLDGLIPDFLGHLPNLKLLNLQRNNFSGEVPQSITSNKKIKFSIDGNSLIATHDKEKKLGLIIGLSVGLPLGALIIGVIAYFLWRRKQKSESKPEPKPKPESEPQTQGSLQDEVSVSINASTELMNLAKPVGENVRAENISGDINGNKPSQGNGVNEQDLSGEHAQVHAGPGEVSDHPSMEPDMDIDELDVLVQQHESTQNRNGRP